jgi:DNA-binding transcriptional regulator YhcF (GntR family)
MGKEQVAGAIVLDSLRERIISGLFLGHWRPGDRLPSIREIAEAERVDRKTAAAAYRRLQEEGLVRVRARSGVYLVPSSAPPSPGPLERLYRQWLEHTYEGARALGVDTQGMLRLISAVARLERTPIPVIECNSAEAEHLAAEVHQRLGVRTTPVLLQELRPGNPLLAEAPLLVTTPYHGLDLALLNPGKPVIEATLAPEILAELRRLSKRGRAVVAVDNDLVVHKVRSALVHCGIDNGSDRVAVVSTQERPRLLTIARQAGTLFMWPGTPSWLDDGQLLPGVERLKPRQTVSSESLSGIQTAILEAAIRQVKSEERAKGVAAHG